ncbi:MAG TPA: ribbon-helix-helix protein, CopG family [Nitrospira sp.]|nr:ribbon-helix-helix protein, CopG family [Candidatus Manganitrophaceae bacterium]
MAKEAFSIRVDSNKVKQLDLLAEQMDRSRNYLVNQAINQFLEVQEALKVKRVKEGGVGAKEERFESDAEVDSLFRNIKNNDQVP